jgi:beta-lactamase regulating signal transducer with metallopeptidase domain
MQALLAFFHTFAQTAAPAAITALWQGLAVAAALGLGLRLAPRISAAHRFLVWCAGFAVVAALPFLPAFASLAAHPAAQVASPTPSAAWLELTPRWTTAIAAFWLVASLFRLGDLAIHTKRLRRLWRSATPVDQPAESPAVRNVQVCTTTALDRPSVIGFFAPRILIPAWLFARLTAGELEQIVLHESQHLRRRDDWTNLAQKLALVLVPLNPALWIIDRRLAREREMACDEGVIRITHAPRAYAACLASLAERGLARRTEALSLGAFERRPELVHRVHSILRSRRALPPIAARAVFASLACGLGLLSFELARCPQLVAIAPVAIAPVARPAPIMTSNLADAVYSPRPRLASAFHAVEAKAVMPIAAAQPLMHRATANHRAGQPSEPAFEQLAAKAPTPLMNAEAKQPQQWIVFTEWEQVETTQPTARAAINQPTADYETGQLADTVNPATPAAQSAASVPSQPTSHIRVTQLVLRVLPTASKSHQRTAIPFGDGWLVIQL